MVCFMNEHRFQIMPDSEAETYFIKTIMPHCKDTVWCRLGAIYGKPYNEYIITDKDYIRCHKFIKKLKGE